MVVSHQLCPLTQHKDAKMPSFFWTKVACVKPLWHWGVPAAGEAQPWVLSLIKLFVSQRRRVPELGHQPELQPCQSIQYTQYPLSPWVSASGLARVMAGWQGRAGLTCLRNSHPAEARMSVRRRKKGNKYTRCYSILEKIYIYNFCTVMILSSSACFSAIIRETRSQWYPVFWLNNITVGGIYSIWGK